MTEVDIERELARAEAQAREAGERARERFALAGRATGEAASRDGSIRVEVGPGGLPVAIDIAPAALRGGAERVAEAVLELSRRATRRAGDRMYHTLGPVLGASGARYLREMGYEPIPDDDPDAPPLPGHGR